MGIIIYQIGIFITIQISAMFGKKSRNTAVILIFLFTVLQVYTFGLMFFQFLTIWISFYFAKKWFSNKKKYRKEDNPFYNDELICVRDENGGRARMYKSDYEKMNIEKEKSLQNPNLKKRNEFYDNWKSEQ